MILNLTGHIFQSCFFSPTKSPLQHHYFIHLFILITVVVIYTISSISLFPLMQFRCILRIQPDTRDEDIHDQSPILGWPFFVRNLLHGSKNPANPRAREADLQQHDCNFPLNYWDTMFESSIDTCPNVYRWQYGSSKPALLTLLLFDLGFGLLLQRNNSIKDNRLFIHQPILVPKTQLLSFFEAFVPTHCFELFQKIHVACVPCCIW